MILPPQRGQARPRVVFLSTSISSGLSSAISSITPQHYKDRTEDRNRGNQQHEHAQVETANQTTIRRSRQRGAAHRTLRFHVNTRDEQQQSRRQDDNQQMSPSAKVHYGSSSGGGATGCGSLNW